MYVTIVHQDRDRLSGLEPERRVLGTNNGELQEVDRDVDRNQPLHRLCQARIVGLLVGARKRPSDHVMRSRKRSCYIYRHAGWAASRSSPRSPQESATGPLSRSASRVSHMMLHGVLDQHAPASVDDASGRRTRMNNEKPLELATCACSTICK